MAKQHDHPAAPIWVASLTDAAWDRSHAKWPELSAAYADSRSQADLEALPVSVGMTPTLFRVRALPVLTRALVLSHSTLAAQRLSALRFGLADKAVALFSGAMPTGEITPLRLVEGATTATVHEDELQSIANLYGGVVLDEIADVILHRLDLPPARFLPFPLPVPSAMWR